MQLTHKESLLMILGCVVLISLAQTVFVPLVFGIFFGMIWTSIVLFLEKRSRRTYRQLAVTTLLILSGMIVGGFALGSLFIERRSVVSYMQDALAGVYQSLVTFLPEKYQINVSNSLSGSLSEIFYGVTDVFTFLAQLGLSFVYSIGVTLGFPFLKKNFSQMKIGTISFPSPETIRIITIRYLLGLSKMIVFLWIAYSLILILFNVNYAPILALLAAVFAYLPTVGTTIGIVFVSLTTYVMEDNLQTALLVRILMVGVQIFDEYYVTPYFAGKAVEVNIYASLFFITFFGRLRGIAGIFLSIRIAGLLVDTMKRNHCQDRYITILT